MRESIALLGFATLTAAVVYGWRLVYLRGLVLDRLDDAAQPAEQQAVDLAARRAVLSLTGNSPLSRPFHWISWVLIVPLGITLYFVVRLPGPYCVSLAVITGLLGSQL